MTDDRETDAITAAAGLGMLGGIVVIESAALLGALGTAVVTIVMLAIAVAAGRWLLPDAETEALLQAEQELLEGGDRS